MSVPVIVYGAGGLGREVMQIVILTLCAEEFHALGYVDDGIPAGKTLNGRPVLGGAEYLDTFEGNVAVAFGIADPAIKAKLYGRFSKKNNITFPNIIHPSTLVSEYASLGIGVVAAGGSGISVDAVVGNCVFLSNGALIGHDAHIGDFSSIMPLAAVSGGVRIGKRCLIGVQSAIKQGVSIGDGATVGMGSVVLRDVPDGVTVIGNPAKVLDNTKERVL